jgi:hypothetical protein
LKVQRGAKAAGQLAHLTEYPSLRVGRGRKEGTDECEGREEDLPVEEEEVREEGSEEGGRCGRGRRWS